MAGYIIVPCAVCVILTTGSFSFATFTAVFATSNECAFCHISGPNALVDRAGSDLSIADDGDNLFAASLGQAMVINFSFLKKVVLSFFRL